MRPGDVVHTEPYDCPPTGAPYLLSVVVKRSGGYSCEARQLDEPHASWNNRVGVGKGYKTVRGAVAGAKRLAEWMEDQTYRPGYDD